MTTHEKKLAYEIFCMKNHVGSLANITATTFSFKTNSYIRYADQVFILVDDHSDDLHHNFANYDLITTQAQRAMYESSFHHSRFKNKLSLCSFLIDEKIVKLIFSSEEVTFVNY
jgi:hypothetical protein